MANLINRVREISRSIKDLEGLKATEEEANLFKTRAEDMSSLSDQIQKPAEQIELFWNGSVAVETPTFQANQLRLQLEVIQNDYAADRKSIIAPSTKWRFDTKKGTGEHSEKLLSAVADSMERSPGRDEARNGQRPVAPAIQVNGLPGPVSQDSGIGR